jgi:hypothetical protein
LASGIALHNMKISGLALLPLVSLLLVPATGRAQDKVTIPKSRLEELERKEKELEKLKGSPPERANITPAATPAAPSAATNQTEPVIKLQLVPLAELPAFRDGESVEAIELASYYLQDPAAADQRFKKHKMIVRGEITGFEKPMFLRNYRILLKGPERDKPIICDLLRPETLNSVFTSNHGAELVGMQGETRVGLAKVGQKVMVQGVCKGRHDTSVLITATHFWMAN